MTQRATSSHHDQRQAPRRDLDKIPPVRIEIGKEILRIERAKLGPWEMPP
jgi:hypothetical protein